MHGRLLLQGALSFFSRLVLIGCGTIAGFVGLILALFGAVLVTMGAAKAGAGSGFAITLGLATIALLALTVNAGLFYQTDSMSARLRIALITAIIVFDVLFLFGIPVTLGEVCQASGSESCELP